MRSNINTKTWPVTNKRIWALPVPPYSQLATKGSGWSFAKHDFHLRPWQASQEGKAKSDLTTKIRNIKDLPVIGWREWVKLPDLGVSRIKVKVDTGARSSALHAFDVHEFVKDGDPWVRFKIHPQQRSVKKTIKAEAKILDYRMVKNTGGKATRRPVILTHVTLLGLTWPVELTLANRDEMGFRMLLGREAIRRRLLVDPGGSFYGGKPRRKKKKSSVKKPSVRDSNP